MGLESTVLSLLGVVPVLLRPGAVTKEQIETALNCKVELPQPCSEGPALSPGMKYRHYAPATPVKVFRTWGELHSFLEGKEERKRMLLASKPLERGFPCLDFFSLEPHEFYSLLRYADASGYEEILILCDETVRKNAALMNRLLRSAE